MRLPGCLLAILAIFSGCAALPPVAPPAERIVFASTRDGNTDIYIANPDGSGLRRLTQDAAPDEIPRCSPDGRHVVFRRGDADSGELYRIDLRDGSEVRLTSNSVRDSTPQWSPDGRFIYFTRREGRFDRIAIMPAAGGEARYLTDGTAHDTMPGIAPDGRSLVHHTYRYGRDTELHVLDLAGGASRRLTQAPGSDYEASFVGNDQVVFSSNREGGHYRLYLAPASGGDARLLADTGTDAWGPRHSARSGDILFHTGPRDNWRLMRIRVDGGAPTPIVADGHSNSGGDWCPGE